MSEIDKTFHKYFNADGSFKLPVAEYFDQDDDYKYTKRDIHEALKTKLPTLPATSLAVALYYAEAFAGQTHGNYSEGTLFYRWMP